MIGDWFILLIIRYNQLVCHIYVLMTCIKKDDAKRSHNAPNDMKGRVANLIQNLHCTKTWLGTNL